MKQEQGRPTKYKKEYVEQAYKLALLGATDEDVANFFEVDIATLYRWKNKHKCFREALKDGKDRADAEVAKKLYHRAKGYSCPDEKIFLHEGKPVVVPTVKHYPPDATSAIFWLKNRQPARWRDKQNIEETGNINVNFNIPRPPKG